MSRAPSLNRRAPKPIAEAPAPEISSRDWTDRKATDQALRAARARQNSGRRRFVDPTTCEREYSRAELEFMQAMHDYKQASGRMFPTWSEVLEVLQGLGYVKCADAGAIPPPPGPCAAPEPGASS